jgi:DNA-binding HxlR family transcriptional regulator
MSSESTALRSGTDSLDRPLFADPEEIFDDAQAVLGPKWHLPIVYHLLESGPMGFSALKSETEGVSSKMLSESLQSLEAAGIVHREVLTEQPVRVEYSLTERGRALDEVVSAVLNWGVEFDPTEGE